MTGRWFILKNKFEVRGNVTAIFLKSNGEKILETLIDTIDFPKVDLFEGTWYRAYNKTTQSYYVVGETSKKLGNRKHIRLHRYITEPDDGVGVDHFNHDTLDNRRENLRFATKSQNGQNRKGAQRNSTSGVRGVSWNRLYCKWEAYYQLDSKKYNLGLFVNIDEAKLAAETARAKHHPFSIEAFEQKKFDLQLPAGQAVS